MMLFNAAILATAPDLSRIIILLIVSVNSLQLYQLLSDLPASLQVNRSHGWHFCAAI
jgi:hypothetical protein